jgi:CheY-like chemotaxis protein
MSARLAGLRPLVFPLTVLAIGPGSTTLVWHQARRAVEAQDRERFEAAADQLQDSIRDRLGATFTVSMPAVSATGEVDTRRDRHRTDTVRHDSRSLQDKRVLIVDDEPDALALAGEILRQHGATVISVTSAREGLRALTEGGDAIALLVSDIAMPQMDGLELIRHIRDLPPRLRGNIPAIALTAYAGADDQRRAIAAGFDLHVTKPFTPTELITACTMVIRDSATQRGATPANSYLP